MEKRHLFRWQFIGILLFLLGGQLIYGYGEGPSCSHQTYKAFTGITGGIISGNYYLAKDVGLNSALQINSGSTVNLCLNGHKIDAGGRVKNCFVVMSGGTLNLYDCQAGTVQERYYYYNQGQDQMVLVDEKPANFENLEGIKGSFQGGVLTGAVGGPAVLNGGNFNFYGGTIAGNNNDQGNGGGISSDVGNGKGVQMLGGHILGNKTAGDGGGLYIRIKDNTKPIYTIKNSTIAHNMAAGNGGGLAISATTKENSGVKIDFNNSQIQGNYAAGNGGGLYIMSAVENGLVCTIQGGQITGNKAGEGSGQGIYNNQGEINLDKDAVVQDTLPPSEGGNGGENTDNGSDNGGEGGDGSDIDDGNGGDTDDNDKDEGGGGEGEESGSGGGDEDDGGDDQNASKPVVRPSTSGSSYAAVRPDASSSKIASVSLQDNPMANGLKSIFLWTVQRMRKIFFLG